MQSVQNVQNGARPRVLVAGGGFGGLESAFYLRRRLGDGADITLVSDRDYFLFKPNTIYIPFGLDPEKLKVGLARPMRRKGISFVKDRIREVDPDNKRVTAEGHSLSYDYLILATGADMRPAEVPGLAEHAETVWTPQEMLRLRLALYELLEDAREGRHRRVLFLVAPNNKCAGPLYELVMMLDTWLRRKAARANVDLSFSTYEQSYIQAFGPRLHGVVAEEFDRRVIAGHTGRVAEEVEPGAVRYAGGESQPYDLLVAFSPYAAEVAYPRLPGDDRGFVSADLASRQVVGHPDIYAAGDAGDFPVKQAFLAFLQADAAAEHIAARVLGEEPATGFEPVSLCVMEQFDKATFAQVPLRLTGLPERPIEVDPETPEDYKVGSYPAWRLGKKALGYYLPFRFALGNPFHAGVPWKGMETGLKAMSALLAK